SDWIHPGTQLLYTGRTSECADGCECITAGSLHPPESYGLGLSAVFCGCCYEPFGPGRHDAVHARLGDGLAEVFAGDGDLEGTAHGGLMNIFCGLSAVASLRPTMAFPIMPERILHSLKDFRFVARERADGLGIEADWRGVTQCPSNAIIRRDDVPKHFAYRANACGRTPGVFLSSPRRDRWSAVHRS